MKTAEKTKTRQQKAPDWSANRRSNREESKERLSEGTLAQRAGRALQCASTGPSSRKDIDGGGGGGTKTNQEATEKREGRPRPLGAGPLLLPASFASSHTSLGLAPLVWFYCCLHCFSGPTTPFPQTLMTGSISQCSSPSNVKPCLLRAFRAPPTSNQLPCVLTAVVCLFCWRPRLSQ